MCIVWENMVPGTELPHIFCAGIGPLQLGFVLVFKSLKPEGLEITTFEDLNLDNASALGGSKYGLYC